MMERQWRLYGPEGLLAASGGPSNQEVVAEAIEKVRETLPNLFERENVLFSELGYRRLWSPSGELLGKYEYRGSLRGDDLYDLRYNEDAGVIVRHLSVPAVTA